jgi:hypothetical protein
MRGLTPFFSLDAHPERCAQQRLVRPWVSIAAVNNRPSFLPDDSNDLAELIKQVQENRTKRAGSGWGLPPPDPALFLF